MKLHLPKVLFAAVVAAVCCVQQTMAADYSVYTSTDITDPETSEVITPAYGYSIIQWTGGRSDKLNGLCYGEYHKASYNSSTQKLVVGEVYAGSQQTLESNTNPNTSAYQQVLGCTDSYTNNWNTILIDSGNHSNSKEIFYDISNVRISGLIVTAESNIDTLKANTNGRNTIIGKDGGAKSYTTIAKNFTLNMNGSTLDLAGTQEWNITDGATFTITTFTNNAALTVNGALKISNTLINNGTITMGADGTVEIASLDGFDVGSFSGVDYTAKANGVQQVAATRVIIMGSGTNNLSTVTYNGGTYTLSDGLLSADASVYVVSSGVVTAGGSSSTPGLENIDFFAVGDNGTLNIAGDIANMSSSLILRTTQGEGKMMLSTTAGITANQSIAFSGDLYIAQGGTLKFGQGKGVTATMSLLDSLVFDGGTMEYNAKGTSIQNVTVTGNGGSMKILDFENFPTNGTSTPINFTGDTLLTGNLTIETSYKSAFDIDHLTGGGKLTITTTDRADGGANVSIDSLSGFTGSFDLQGNTNNKAKVTLNLDKGYTLNASQITVNAAAKNVITLKGSGTYNLGELAKNSASAKFSKGEVTVEGWTGTVSIYGGERKTGSDNTQDVQNINFNNLGVAGSTVEIAKQGLYGYLGNGETYNPNIKLTGDFYIQNGNQNQSYTFDGTVSGSGNINMYRTGGSGQTYIFQKNISGWDGTMNVNTNAGVTTKVKLTGTATEVNAAIITEDTSGTMALEVDNADKTTTFNNTVTVDSVSTTAKSSVKLGKGGDMTTDSFSLGDGGTLTLAGGTLTVTNSITLSTVTVDFSQYFDASKLEENTYSKTLVTAGGITGWAGDLAGTYTADGTEYTTSVKKNGNSIELTFKGPDDVVHPGITSLVVGDLSLIDTQLTLAIDQDLTSLTGAIDLTLSDSALATLASLPAGDVSLLLQGSAGSIDSVDYDGAISFYGSYVGEGAGMYKVEYIPEPATATLSLLALAGLAARRRRK